MATAAVAKSDDDDRERRNVTINVRASTYVRDLIDYAASVLGKTRSDFMLESARTRAEDVLLDRRLFSLDDKNHEEFLALLDNPAPPSDRLKALLKRKPPWET